MSPNQIPDATQPQVLRAYTALVQLHPNWGGALILSLGLDPHGAALSMAANIAGAVSLAIDNNPIHLRDAARAGACDFLVNTLDEAIRAMKNEARKHAPLSVALNTDPHVALNEITERGLTPQVFANFLPQDARISQTATYLASLGVSLVDFQEDTLTPTGFQSSQSLLTPLLCQRGWDLQTFTFDTPASLRAFDSKALSLLPPDDTLRRRWLEAAPRILQRQRPPQRSLWLTRAESESFRNGQ